MSSLVPMNRIGLAFVPRLFVVLENHLLIKIAQISQGRGHGCVRYRDSSSNRPFDPIRPDSFAEDFGPQDCLAKQICSGIEGLYAAESFVAVALFRGQRLGQHELNFNNLIAAPFF